MKIECSEFIEKSVRWVVAPVLVIAYYAAFTLMPPANLMTLLFVGSFLFGMMPIEEFLEYVLAPFSVAKEYIETGKIP